jgi:SRSO17 transposase
MSLVFDVRADLPKLADLGTVRGLTAEEAASLAEGLTEYHQHFAPFFYRLEQRKWAELYLRGLLTADVPRKNVEAMALRLLGVGPHAERQVRALQQFIGEGKWDDDARLPEHQRLVNETLGEEDGVLIVDGSDFPKHGEHSAGVAPQWCGHTGKKDNCQAGVFVGYASRKGATFLDRRLYLPESWFDEDHQTRWQDCQIPDEITFQTKHELAAQLVEGVMASGRLQARWVACDEGYGDAPAFEAPAGRDGVMLSGRGPARYQGLATPGNGRADGARASQQLGPAPGLLTQRPCSPP